MAGADSSVPFPLDAALAVPSLAFGLIRTGTPLETVVPLTPPRKVAFWLRLPIRVVLTSLALPKLPISMLS